MRDSEVVAAIVARDPDGLAEAYDKYAAGLFGFCRSLLREPADAADAVQDTFVIAASKAAELRDPDRLRPWLYAVARNECHRRLRAGTVPATLDVTAGLADQGADASDLAARAQLRDLVRAAIMGLNPGDQEVIELSLRHELHGPDLADALGVPRNHAHALLSRARSQLEKSLGALLVARAGRQDCPVLDSLLDAVDAGGAREGGWGARPPRQTRRGWDGTLTVLMRKRVHRHIERCEVCGERKRRELRPVMLLGFAPLTLIPYQLRAQVLHLITDPSAAAAAQRTAIVQHAGVAGAHGFPVATALPGHGVAGAAHAAAARAGLRWPLAHGHAGHTAAIAGTTATAAVAGVIAVLVMMVPQHSHQGGPAVASPHRAGQPTGAFSPAPRVPKPSGTAPAAAGAPAQQGTGRPAIAAAARGGPAAPGAGASGGAGPGTPPAGTPPGPATTTHAPTPAPAPAVNGPVSVSPGSLALIALLTGSATGTLTLTAGSTPVTHYTVTVPSSLLGNLTVSPASGSIPAHGRQQVTVTVHGLLSLDTTVAVSPGGQTATVLFGLHLGN
jgi:RNA polymerase sigma factor (sigma-70 family)